MKALLSVSFGTSHADTRVKTIDAIDADLAAAFPDRAFYSAWTSSIIMKKVLAERGEQHDSLDEAFARMTADGVNDVVVATMCLMQGHEMGKIAKAVDAWVSEGGRTARLAAPLTGSDDDKRAIARALCDEFVDVPADDAVLFMGHGSSFGGNETYTGIQDALDELQDGRFFVATVEGVPTFDDVLQRLWDRGPACVHLAPLMVVAGDHAKNDLAGDDEDSWASILQAHGFKTQAHLRGLGEYRGIRELACKHALEA